MLGLFLWRWDRRQSKGVTPRETPNEHGAGTEAGSDAANDAIAYLQCKAELDEQRRHELENVEIRGEVEANERHELEGKEPRRKEEEGTPL